MISAVTCFERALAVDKNDVNTLNNYAQMLMQSGVREMDRVCFSYTNCSLSNQQCTGTSATTICCSDITTECPLIA